MKVSNRGSSYPVNGGSVHGRSAVGDVSGPLQELERAVLNGSRERTTQEASPLAAKRLSDVW